MSQIEAMPVTRLGPQPGYEVKGLDLSKPIDDAAFKRAVLDPLYQHSAIVLRGQDLTPEQLKAFGARLGPLETHVFTQHLLDGHREILLLSNIEEGGRVI